MSEATCNTCSFCNPLPNFKPQSYPDAGECRRHAPTIWPDPAYIGQGTWPLIIDITSSWCGEHPARKEQG